MDAAADPDEAGLAGAGFDAAADPDEAGLDAAADPDSVTALLGLPLDSGAGAFADCAVLRRETFAGAGGFTHTSPALCFDVGGIILSLFGLSAVCGRVTGGVTGAGMLCLAA